MNRIKSILIVTLAILSACHHDKPKPISNNITKVAIAVNGKKDSVNNNQQKLYNASIPEPCIKCLLQTIEKSESYKNATRNVQPQTLIYNINWVSGPDQNVSKPGSGMRIDILKKNSSNRENLATYLYNNTDAKLYLLNKKNKFDEDQLKIDSISLKKIRNSCFWGVASAK